MRALFNQVQRVFTKIGDWVLDMQLSILQEKGLQDLMDLSESVIQNHIDVMVCCAREYTRGGGPVSHTVGSYQYLCRKKLDFTGRQLPLRIANQ